MDQILEGLRGIVSIGECIAFLVFGENEEEHNKNLINPMEQAAGSGIVFNRDKCTIKQKSVSFFSNLYTAKGIRPDRLD